MRARAVAVLVSGCLLGAVVPAVARAEAPPADTARLAYERGLRAHAVGDHGAAARAFFDADRAVPSDEAIEAALDAAVRANDPVLGMQLVARAEARALDPRATSSKDKARAAFAGRVARLVVSCGTATYCHARVDAGEDTDAREPLFVTAGPHSVRITLDARSYTAGITAIAGADMPLEAPHEGLVARPGPPTKVPPSGDGVRPGRVVVLVGAGLSGVLAAITVASTIDLFSTRGAFQDERCGVDAGPLTLPGPSCATLASDGASAEVRTFALLGATATTLLATLATEIFFVPKRTTKAAALPAVRLALGERRAGLTLELPLP